jgi:biopolymer transport protein ExbB
MAVMEPALSYWFTDLLARGGWVMAVLLVFSLVGLAIVIGKLQQFARARIWSRAWLNDALSLVKGGDQAGALALARTTPGPVARVLAIALEERARDDLSPEAVREEVQRAGDAELGTLESHLRGLEVIGSLAPLLGLLGTVLGMIRAFMRLEEAGSRVDPGLLSGGIWEALLTTAVGIAVAIPAMAALAWLESQVDGVRRTLGDAATRVLNAPRGGAGSRIDAGDLDLDHDHERIGTKPPPLRPAGTRRAL